MVAPPHQARPPESRLHLVSDQHGTMFVGNVPDRWQKAWWRYDIPRRCLDRFHNERPELLLEIISEQTQDSAGFSMEAAPKPNELKSARGGFGQAKSRLYRLRSTRKHLNPAESLGRHRCDQVQKLGADLCGEAAERQLFDLSFQGLHIMGMAMTDTAHSDASHKIDVALSVFINQCAAAPLRHRQPGIEGDGLQAWGHVPLFLFHDALGPGTWLVTIHVDCSPANRSVR